MIPLLIIYNSLMIDPKSITNYHRTPYELEEFLLFCVVVAGKNSHIQAQKLDRFLDFKPVCNLNLSPFQKIESMAMTKTLVPRLKEVGMGQYGRISRAFSEASTLLPPLATRNLLEIESVYGIGPKTSRFFLLHSRQNQRYAVLDTHILKWLKARGYEGAPKATPSGSLYSKWEAVFLRLCDSVDTSPAELDLMIWKDSNKQR